MKVANTLFMAICDLSPLRLPRIHNQQLLTLCWCSLSGWGRKSITVCYDQYGRQCIKIRPRHTKLNIWRFTVAYVKVTINRKTRKLEPENCTDRASRTLQNPQDDGQESWFGLPRGTASEFWMGLEPHWPILVVWTGTAGRLPGPVATLGGHCHNVPR